MESMGVQGEWTSLSGIYTADEADFMAQLLSNFSVPDEQNGGSSFGSLQTTSWPDHEFTMDMAAGNNEGSNCSLEINNSNLYSFSSQGSTNSYNNSSTGGSSSILFPTCHKMLATNNNFSTTTSIDFCMGLGDLQNTNSYLNIRSGNVHCLNQLGMSSDGNREELESGNISDNPQSVIPQQNLKIAKKYDMTESEPLMEVKVTTPSTKRSRCSSENVQSDKTKTKSKKSKKLVSTSKNEEERLNGGHNGQSSTSCSSGDDFNASQDLSGGGLTSSLSLKESLPLNSTGKTRARRGSATDPQSLYARKRRERINERLKILQTLVPNGTKVDISTMLEEAVQYVKFLQIQIKLLSSDDLWMYAPIAYNGKDIGLDLNLTLAKES